MFASFPARCSKRLFVGVLFSFFLCFVSACGGISISTTSTSPTATKPPTPTATKQPTPTATPTNTPPPTPTSSTPQYVPTHSASGDSIAQASYEAYENMAEALKYKDYTTLYEMTSSEYRARHTMQEMIEDVQKKVFALGDGNPIGQYIIQDSSITNRATDNAAISHVTVIYAFMLNGNISETNPSLIAENNVWKILDFDEKYAQRH